MADIIIRGIPEKLVRAARLRAVENGMSLPKWVVMVVRNRLELAEEPEDNLKAKTPEAAKSENRERVVPTGKALTNSERQRQLREERYR